MKYGKTLIIALAVIGTVGFVAWHLQNPWAWAGIGFLWFLSKTKKFLTECPECNHDFDVIVKHQDDGAVEAYDWISVIPALGICLAVATIVCFSNFIWILLGLVLLGFIKNQKPVSSVCPKCQHNFEATPKAGDYYCDE
ncbi:hypothetical protein ACFL2B_00180 [Patescibacteria group bacterium]